MEDFKADNGDRTLWLVAAPCGVGGYHTFFEWPSLSTGGTTTPEEKSPPRMDGSHPHRQELPHVLPATMPKYSTLLFEERL